MSSGAGMASSCVEISVPMRWSVASHRLSVMEGLLVAMGQPITSRSRPVLCRGLVGSCRRGYTSNDEAPISKIGVAALRRSGGWPGPGVHVQVHQWVQILALAGSAAAPR